ncbi:translation initiation factor IF-2-like [Lolium rigidum]|uniref:translation initiation factor IF-2-like n=1 Tax=Lolium rigidum TaxID=89674 RepID=UPI001F5CDF86|nr:translation initiation factor IF-2-like [Lolium rigidum]
MSGSYSSRLRGGGGGGGLGATTLLAAKVAFASAALAAAASLARATLPQIVSGADNFLWKLYLFVTVHVIIFVIWKLSDNKHFHAAAQQHKDPWAPVPHNPAHTLLTEQAVLSSMKRKVEFAPAAAVVRDEKYSVPPPVSRPHLEPAASPVDEVVVSPGSCGGESCVTTESEEDAPCSAVAASANFATADTWRSVEPAPAPARKRAVAVPAPIPVRQRAEVERVVSLPPPPATAEHFDGADQLDGADDDLDATWNAIMQKKRPSTAPASSAPAPRSSPPPPAPSPRPRAREPSVGAAELSKRSEDFIKKIHNSFGRHQ